MKSRHKSLLNCNTEARTLKLPMLYVPPASPNTTTTVRQQGIPGCNNTVMHCRYGAPHQELVGLLCIKGPRRARQALDHAETSFGNRQAWGMPSSPMSHVLLGPCPPHTVFLVLVPQLGPYPHASSSCSLGTCPHCFCVPAAHTRQPPARLFKYYNKQQQFICLRDAPPHKHTNMFFAPFNELIKIFNRWSYTPTHQSHLWSGLIFVWFIFIPVYNKYGEISRKQLGNCRKIVKKMTVLLQYYQMARAAENGWLPAAKLHNTTWTAKGKRRGPSYP